ncbi:MAG: polysaccharide biosynthesis/export family protein [Bacteroidota bacterium]
MQPNDVLFIQVEADDLEGIAAQPFNKTAGMIGGGGGGGNLIELNGYLVDTAGQIEFPILGTLEVGGKTTSEAREELEGKLLPYIKAPIVNIRFLNFRVNIMGEVGAPGVITTTNERLTIMEAITQAGGLTPVGNATNILIVREKGNQREYGRINLKDRAVFHSPYFYLYQNDVIYIEPLETKITQVRDPAQRIFPWVSLGISTITFLIAVLGSN